MSKSKTYKLILTSKGLNTRKGTILIRRAYEKEKIKYGSIFLITFPRYEVDEIVVRNCEELGFENIFLAKEFEGKSICEMPEVDVIYVTEGNTFEIIDYIRKNHFDTYLLVRLQEQFLHQHGLSVLWILIQIFLEFMILRDLTCYQGRAIFLIQ